MFSMMDTLVLIASVASILGATISVYQCFSAKKAVKRAMEIRDEIVKKKSTIDLTIILSKANDIDKILIGYKLDNSTRLRGADFNKDIVRIEEFLSFLNTNKSLVNGLLREFLDEKYRQLSESMALFNFENKKNIADLMSICVREITSKISDEINSTTFY